MNRTKRQEYAIVTTFFFNIVFLIIISSVIIFYSYPKFLEVESQKNQTEQLSQEFEKIVKSGISFSDFKEMLSKKWKEVTWSLRSIDQDFFEKSLENTWNKTFTDFIEEKKVDLNNPVKIKKISQQAQVLNQVLPTYVEDMNIIEEWFLSDFKFIHYIESLLRGFQFKYSNTISIGDLQLLTDYELDKKDKTDIDLNIFSIPLDLELTGSKKEIINFLYYIQNVWKVELIEDKTQTWSNIATNKSFEVIADKKWVFNASRIRSILKQDNVFENQIMDIVGITMPEYIDTHYKMRDWDLMDFIKDTQWSEEFSINISLVFFVKGMPNFKLTEYMATLNSSYNLSKKALSTKLKDKDLTIIERKTLLELNNSFNELWKSINKLKQSIEKKEGLSDAYKSIQNYKIMINDFNKIMGYNSLYYTFKDLYISKKKILEKYKTQSGGYYTDISIEIVDFMENKILNEKEWISMSYKDYWNILYYNSVLETIK